ncbi:hypothetical protein Nocox_17950 [Nonomuraea coxensis DSM 45129]|uniref:Core-binding (CB) domain-containing protein n=2 Tax=Nonomuraea coxensis TaxID=404386 RepID=A0ABX8U253_9ACTN|nr:hypothetical protein Nocox_17950 [Nonomuraea coxensis DSM 45129]
MLTMREGDPRTGPSPAPAGGQDVPVRRESGLPRRETVRGSARTPGTPVPPVTPSPDAGPATPGHRLPASAARPARAEGDGPGDAEQGSIGEIPGLRPRRRPRDGGEVPGSDVDLVDALDPLARRTVSAWLRGKPSAAARQVAFQVMASFLRWLQAAEPGVELLAVTGAHLEAYCEAARTGGVPRSPGRPLTSKTVSRKRAALLSFYTYAWRCGVVRHNQVAGSSPARSGNGAAVTPEERRLLRQGVARLAADGRTTEAAAVALLELTGAAVEALAGLTRQDVRTVPDGTTGQPAVVTVNHGRDDVAAFLVTPLARPLLRVLCASRPAGEPLIRRPDGRALDTAWLGTALTAAARAGGVPEHRARRLTPAMLRATNLTDLLNPR